MKKLLSKYVLLVLFLILFGPIPVAQAQFLKLGLLDPIVSTIHVSYEYVLPDDYHAIQASLSGTRQMVQIWEEITPVMWGYSIGLEGKKYMEPIDVANYYVSAYLTYANYQLSLDTDAVSVDFLTGNSKIAGISVGWLRSIQKNLFVEINLGLGYHFANYSGKFSERGKLIPSIVSNGIIPRINVMAVYSFW